MYQTYEKALSQLLLNSMEVHAPVYDSDIDGCSDTLHPVDRHVPTGTEPTPDSVNKSDKYQMPSLITDRSKSNLIQPIKPEHLPDYLTKAGHQQKGEGQGPCQP